VIKGLAEGIDGLVTIAVNAPGQIVRTIAQLPVGDDMNQGYFFDSPQLFKMPKKFVEPSPRLTASPVGSDDMATKALPYVAGGIALFVAYNIFFKR